MKSKERVKHYQALYQEMVEENQMLEKFLERLELIHQHQLEMSKYYQSDWIKDYDNPPQLDEPINILDQDSIYDALYDQDRLLLKINYMVAKQLVGDLDR